LLQEWTPQIGRFLKSRVLNSNPFFLQTRLLRRELCLCPLSLKRNLPTLRLKQQTRRLQRMLISRCRDQRLRRRETKAELFLKEMDMFVKEIIRAPRIKQNFDH
jgi:hypothetical protein